MSMPARTTYTKNVELLVRADESCRLHPRRAKNALITFQVEGASASHELEQLGRLPQEAQERVLNEEVTTKCKDQAASFYCAIQKHIAQKDQTAILLRQRKPSRPSGSWGDLKGGGPPSAVRAAVNVLHGVPQCRKKTTPRTRISTKLCQKVASTKSTGVRTRSDATMSTGGRTGTPAKNTASVIPAFPAKSSRKMVQRRKASVDR